MVAIDLAIRTRTLHLIDIENLVGGTEAREEEIVRTVREYLRVAHWRAGDLVLIAANPHLAARFAWSIDVEHRTITAIGHDGADLALLAQAAPEFVARRAGRLVVGSGDHIFIRRALQVRELGVGVAVVAGAGCSAQRLARAWVPGRDAPRKTVGACCLEHRGDGNRTRTGL